MATKKRHLFHRIDSLKYRALTRRKKIAFALLYSIGVLLTIIFAVWWFLPAHIPANFHGYFHLIDVCLFGLLSYVVWYQIMNELFIWSTVFTIHHPYTALPEPGKRVAFLTAFVPGKEPYDVLQRTLRAMVSAEYPHDTWLLDEGDDEQAERMCFLLGVKHFSRAGKPYYNTQEGKYKAKTKAGNYNAWYDLHQSDYDYVAQIDVDFLPRQDFLTKTLGYFRDPDVAFVGSPQVYGNTDESWITRGAAQQAYTFHGPMQKGFFGVAMPLFIGANHVVRTRAHRAIAGYAGHIVEDHLTGMRFYAQHWKSVYVPEILAVGEGPSTWDAYFSQQMRWSYGLFHILFTQSLSLFRQMKPIHVLYYYLLQQYYFFGVAQAAGILLLTLYFLFGIESTTMTVPPLLVTYGPLIFWQQLLFFWIQQFNIAPGREKGWMWEARFLNFAAWPIYFLAFVGVMIGKKLTYAVTPKGHQQNNRVPLSLFIPHLIFGTITAVDVVVGIQLHHTSLPLLFWASITTISMYGLVLFVYRDLLFSLFRRKQDVRVKFFTSRWEKLLTSPSMRIAGK